MACTCWILEGKDMREERERDRDRNGKRRVSVNENRCFQLFLTGDIVLMNLREFGSERVCVVEVEILAGPEIRCVLMMENISRYGILLYMKTKRNEC